MHLQVDHQNNDFTANQRACIDGYYAGHTTDKDLARHLGISIAALRSRFHGLFYRGGVPFGARREQAMLQMWEKGLIDVKRAAKKVAAILLCILSLGLTPIGPDDTTITMARLGRGKPGRNPTVRVNRTGRRDPLQSLIDDLMESFNV